MEFHAVIPTLASLPAVARDFVNAFPGKKIFLFYGDMGAGKTTFIRAVCAALGAPDGSSPTFALVNEYTTAEGALIRHLDLYRLRSLRDVLDIGVEEYLHDDAMLFVEWPELLEPIIDEAVRVKLSLEGHGRRIEAEEGGSLAATTQKKMA